ncbi:MAG: hypothetical protein CMK02_07945 [Polycyclovorans sp.]|nr:hypothetical protein [Polycyclovorans sp.]QDP49860.1 MAG: hypothetical protein GOVbin132_4 [Prokaryotic dsDNA virus sp.]
MLLPLTPIEQVPAPASGLIASGTKCEQSTHLVQALSTFARLKCIKLHLQPIPLTRRQPRATKLQFQLPALL